MDAERMQQIAERDQLWANLRALIPEIEPLALGQFENTRRQQEVAQLLARIVLAELRFRAEEGAVD